MTWIFAYAVALLLGLLLWVASGPHGRPSAAAAAGPVTLPRADAGHSGHPRAARAVGAGLAVLGLAGIGLTVAAPGSPGAVALAAAGGVLAAFLAAGLAMRRRAPQTADLRQVTVVRDIAPGAYGQVELDGVGRRIVMAAFNAGDSILAAGSIAEVVSDERSVLTVRRPPALP